MFKRTPSPAAAASPARNSRHAFVIGLGATLLTGAVFWFNGSYGYSKGGWGWVLAFVGFAIVKDSALSYAWAARGEYGRIAAGFLGVIGLFVSGLAAIGAASHGSQEASDPKAALIARYDSAERTRNEAARRLAEIGSVPMNAAEAEAQASALLARVDPAIVRRTKGCTDVAPQSNGPRQVAVNREACQPYKSAAAQVDTAAEASRLRAQRDAAEAILAEGKPATADAQASTLAVFFGLFTALNGIAGIQAWTNLFIGLGLEISSPLAWAAFASAMNGHRVSMSVSAPATEKPKTDTVAATDSEQSDFSTFASNDFQALKAMVAGELPDPTPPRGGRKSRKTKPENVIQFPAKHSATAQHPVITALETKGGSVASNHELAQAMKVSDGEASKRWQEIEHLLDVEKIGKQLRISLKDTGPENQRKLFTA